MFIVKDDYSGQDTFEELFRISRVQQFVIVSSYELSKVSNKNNGVTSENLVTVFVLPQPDI